VARGEQSVDTALGGDLEEGHQGGSGEDFQTSGT
jgi:hypothetical protein